MANLETILPVTLKFEGLWSDNKNDPGGATMEGITLTTMRIYDHTATAEDLRHISPAEVQHIYDVGFFQPIGGPALSQGVAMVAFDYGVNSGKGRAISALRQTAGLIGSDRVRKISDERLSFDHALKTWAYFGKGWGSRVGQCEAIALKWEASSPGIAKAEIQVSVNDAKRRAKTNTVIAATSTAATAPTVTASKEQLSLSAAIGVSAILIAVALICGLIALHNSQRATALKAT